MSFEDKSLRCSDCEATFTFNAGEEEFLSLEAIQTSLSAVRHAAKPGR